MVVGNTWKEEYLKHYTDRSGNLIRWQERVICSRGHDVGLDFCHFMSDSTTHCLKCRLLGRWSFREGWTYQYYRVIPVPGTWWKPRTWNKNRIEIAIEIKGEPGMVKMDPKKYIIGGELSCGCFTPDRLLHGRTR